MNPLEEIRSGSVCARAADASTWKADEDGTVTGRAVPYGRIVELMPGMYEQFERGAFASAVKDPGRTKLAYRHDEIIGRAVELEERDDGLWVRGKVTDNQDLPVARQALALLREGLVDELSVGFTVPRGGCTVTEHKDGTLITTRKAVLREVSVVPWGAYGRHAVVKQVRAETVARLAAEREFWSRFALT